MKDRTMVQYLSEIKQRVDAITAAGSHIEPEDIILYTLNGLPPSYKAFKTSIRTKLHPIHLDDLYALLCSEETNLVADNRSDISDHTTTPDPSVALTVSRGRSCGRTRGRFSNQRGGRSQFPPARGNRRSSVPVDCQICGKYGHSAATCWHRTNLSYQADTPQAFLAQDETPPAEWFLDSGASTHLTSDVSQVQSIQPYTDSDWAANPNDRRSISGYCAFLGDNLLSWSVKKQPTVARSSTEAEYRALALAASDIMWTRRLISDFNIPCSMPTPLFCDNISALALANNPVFHARTKHIEVDYHFIRDCIKNGDIDVHHIASIDQPADILTKAMSSTRFTYLRNKLTICG
ncbi:Retrovirus-related Pol polyprotein from transposon TNT 1-94 [Dendrobium catenatum]|uniref:Retrovirus-related Pol polyprotein from transposon TNT 1-94 n=1 Tax=Dendrobium catenatum TaxID=906689 RepID=A0A2I0WLU8_9ASPA|nr:Retrovirus-related Pol polyprotein from transposon TNT 1-94 [Dendrobium catenatum]